MISCLIYFTSLCFISLPTAHLPSLFLLQPPISTHLQAISQVNSSDMATKLTFTLPASFPPIYRTVSDQQQQQQQQHNTEKGQTQGVRKITQTSEPNSLCQAGLDPVAEGGSGSGSGEVEVDAVVEPSAVLLELHHQSDREPVSCQSHPSLHPASFLSGSTTTTNMLSFQSPSSTSPPPPPTFSHYNQKQRGSSRHFVYRGRKSWPKRAATKELCISEQPGIVFRIHINAGPLILRYPNEYEKRRKLIASVNSTTSTSTHSTSNHHSMVVVGSHQASAVSSSSSTGRKRSSNSSFGSTTTTTTSTGQSTLTTTSTSTTTTSAVTTCCECLAITGIHGAHISNCYLVRNGISQSHQTASLTALCSSCKCLPFIEIFCDGKFQLCISCATKFERVKRKCSSCHWIPKSEERNRRQCSQCRNGTVQCF